MGNPPSETLTTFFFLLYLLPIILSTPRIPPGRVRKQWNPEANKQEVNLRTQRYKRTIQRLHCACIFEQFVCFLVSFEITSGALGVPFGTLDYLRGPK